MSIDTVKQVSDRALKQPSHLLIVDEYQSSLMMQHIFAPDYMVTCAHNDQAALHVLDNTSVDAVLIDLSTPEINGLRLLEEINKQQPTPALIMLSSPETSSQVPQGFRLGAHDYIDKSAQREAALARVQAQLKQRAELAQRNTTIATLEAKVAALEAEKDAQRRMVRMITHDLKHPLSNIRMADSLLRHYTVTAPASGELMDSVLASLDTMQETIEDFSDAYHLKGGVEMDLRATSACQVINDLGLEYMAHAARKDIQIEIGPCNHLIIADQRRLRRAIGNLLNNAVKYSPPGTTVKIASERIDSELRITVTDEGPGVPTDERHMLYTEFGKLSTQPTGQEASTGLGLWIVKMLVEAMGGEVGYEDAPGKGGCFWLQFSLATDSDIASIATEKITDEMPKVKISNSA